MISLTLNTKKCMAELLLRETFDSFLFIEGSVTTFNKFTIDGYIHSDFTLYSPCPLILSAHLLQKMSWTSSRNLCRDYTLTSDIMAPHSPV